MDIKRALDLIETDSEAAFDAILATDKISKEDPWVIADEILTLGLNHPAFKEITRSWDDFKKELEKAGKQEQALLRSGVGRTESVTILNGSTMRKLKDFCDMVGFIIEQIETKTRR